MIRSLLLLILLIFANILRCDSFFTNSISSSTLCYYGGKAFSPGQKFHPDPCISCRCPWDGGRVTCSVKDCREESDCLRHVNVTSFGRDVCCPKCLEYGCRHTDGRVYRQGDVISRDGCMRCYCPLGGGETTCDVSYCPPVLCVDFQLAPGKCCPRCPHGSNCQLGLLTIPGSAVVKVKDALCRCQLKRRGDNFKLEAKCQPISA